MVIALVTLFAVLAGIGAAMALGYLAWIFHRPDPAPDARRTRPAQTRYRGKVLSP